MVHLCEILALRYFDNLDIILPGVLVYPESQGHVKLPSKFSQ